MGGLGRPDSSCRACPGRRAPEVGGADRADLAGESPCRVPASARSGGGEHRRWSARGPLSHLPRSAGGPARTPCRARAVLVAGVGQLQTDRRGGQTMTESMTRIGTDGAALRLTIEVAVGVDRAFEVFTTDFDRIKPREHNLMGEDIAETVLEPRAGGRLYDRGVNGATCDWGRVLAIDPPHRLLLGWHISPGWQIETDPERASEIEVTFTPIDDAHTRVELEHRHLDRHGEGWKDARGALEGGEGWPVYLSRYVELLAVS